MNILFETAPLTWNQWLNCLLLMIPWAMVANRIDPPQISHKQRIELLGKPSIK